ncbi:MAG: hypothetical protein SOZ02_00695 [Hallerella porci]|uniref:Uncharacterized protein n=1 Tax=Hallerella porci TaxID=1945871 RepID=A0ABX5LL71_9BACT|nr:hypothetical protein [Hallerella sp.]MCI5601194.1 hypothetical protein [Hallerella sp.]MDY3920664.1 hypothetical protein [Hallerella porci]PWK92242.1 hypothetical protein B0H50_1379 [Hallerella porci]
MMDLVLLIGALFWLPLILWLALFLWARFFAYPLFLKRQIRRGKTWCYVPEWWSKKTFLRFGTQFLLIFLAILAAFSSTATIFWLAPTPVYWLAFLMVAFLILAKPFTTWAMQRAYRLEINAYFLEYRNQQKFYSQSGRTLSEEDLAGHTAWAFRNAMKKAETEKRLFPYLKEMSKLELASEKEEAHASA